MKKILHKFVSTSIKMAKLKKTAGLFALSADKPAVFFSRGWRTENLRSLIYKILAKNNVALIAAAEAMQAANVYDFKAPTTVKPKYSLAIQKPESVIC